MKSFYTKAIGRITAKMNSFYTKAIGRMENGIAKMAKERYTMKTSI
jgi:hypothetical protein